MIREIGWTNGTLEVLFQPKTKKDGTVVLGALWQYANVPRDVYDSFLHAESPGRFFGMSIKAVYQGRKVEEAREEKKEAD